MSESTLYIHLCENSELCILSTFNSLPLWQLHQNESECELKYTAAAAERAGGLGLGLGIRRERVDRDQSSRLDRGDSQCGVRKNVFDYLFFKKRGLIHILIFTPRFSDYHPFFQTFQNLIFMFLGTWILFRDRLFCLHEFAILMLTLMLVVGWNC